MNPDTWIRGPDTCGWDPSKPPFFLFYSQEISLAWSEVLELVPKRDELLANEKDRQERILCNTFLPISHSLTIISPEAYLFESVPFPVL